MQQTRIRHLSQYLKLNNKPYEAIYTQSFMSHGSINKIALSGMRVTALCFYTFRVKSYAHGDITHA